MKDRERPSGILLELARIFTHNWGLKLVSLVLAILLYYTLKPAPALPRASRQGRPPRGGDHVVEVIEQVARPASPPRAPGKPPDTSDPKKK